MLPPRSLDALGNLVGEGTPGNASQRLCDLRSWQFQAIETALFVLLALMLLAAAIHRVHRRVS
jgi:hypothetical protein